jgi:ABC-type dipeptide/oligopeptide/nickel transport system permease subunit
MLAPWVSLFPGAAIMQAVLSLTVLGDGLRDALDPRAEMR